MWDFLKDVANNLNRKKQGARWSSNSLVFSQAMKMYEGRQMYDLFSLNFGGPNYNSTKCVNHKGVSLSQENMLTYYEVWHISINKQKKLMEFLVQSM